MRQFDPLPLTCNITAEQQRTRLLIFLAWLVLVVWFWSTHVFWRDEVRAFTLALSGSNVVEMVRRIHGEGHPALWYLLLRGAHLIFPYREILPITGGVIGVAAMALFTFRSPFRPAIVALALFSFFGAFEYVVVARNYGIAALTMFVLAAAYGRIKNTPWFGVILTILCNTNVPSCFLAAGFLLFRFVELLTTSSRAAGKEWRIFAVNAILALAGAMMCFATIYPTPNDAAVSPNLNSVGIGSFVSAFTDTAFSRLVLNSGGLFGSGLILLVCLSFLRRPPALIASLAAFIGLKLFFFFVYPSAYRHEALFVVFLLSLWWIVADNGPGQNTGRSWMRSVEVIATMGFVLLLGLQVARLAKPLLMQARNIPYSRSADVAKILQAPSLTGAIVMADPDTMAEALPYYTDNPLWFLRTQQFGRVVTLSSKARRVITPDDVLNDAKRLHRQTGRPIVFLSRMEFTDSAPQWQNMMYDDATSTTPESVRRFRSATRLVARLRPATVDEDYDVYVYPSHDG